MIGYSYHMHVPHTFYIVYHHHHSSPSSPPQPPSYTYIGGPETCQSCECGCGPYTCPTNGQLATAVVLHKRRKRAVRCECFCECKFQCIPDDGSLPDTEYVVLN